MSQALESSQTLYQLFQSLPDDARKDFLSALIKHNREELEAAFFYWDCQSAREDGFLSDEEATNFLLSLPE